MSICTRLKCLVAPTVAISETAAPIDLRFDQHHDHSSLSCAAVTQRPVMADKPLLTHHYLLLLGAHAHCAATFMTALIIGLWSGA